MQIYVYSPEMELLGVIEKITSLIWTRRYWEPGDFKMLVPFNATHNQLLQTGNIIMKHGDSEAAEIMSTKTSKNLEGFEVIEVRGSFLTFWIKKRVIENQLTNVSFTAQNLIKKIVHDNCTNASAARKLPFTIAVDPAIPGDDIMYTSEVYDNCLDVIEEIAQGSKIGFKMLTDRANGTHVFHVYKGVDSTAENALGNPPCIFSQEYDNVLEQEYAKSTEKHRNTAYVSGETKEDESFTTVIVGEENTGLNRNEIHISGGDIKQKYKDENDREVTLTDAQYQQALRDRGTEKLEQYPVEQSFSSEINIGANLIYREDFDLGDRVTCINRNWNVRIDARIVEISETYEVGGEGLEISFGESIPSIYKQIKNMIGG